MGIGDWAAAAADFDLPPTVEISSAASATMQIDMSSFLMRFNLKPLRLENIGRRRDPTRRLYGRRFQ